jgi:hypothetical protein
MKNTISQEVKAEAAQMIRAEKTNKEIVEATSMSASSVRRLREAMKKDATLFAEELATTVSGSSLFDATEVEAEAVVAPVINNANAKVKAGTKKNKPLIALYHIEEVIDREPRTQSMSTINVLRNVLVKNPNANIETLKEKADDMISDWKLPPLSIARFKQNLRFARKELARGIIA